ncbi:MAG: tRNA 2-selenouridine(34) synthase MnmH [Proteobacteria bacterium]|nr:tRNA 2-selenouridine(34) synthase MnmH [Pseudomonadota bacterium]
METVLQIDGPTLARFDAVIDVRSPGEFAEDHLPGAINLPVLSNEERARVGTIYVQESRFLARRIGAAIIARNVAQHLDTVLADKPGSFRPLVYCWRGGQRSGAMATILANVGWRTGLLAGGYRTWRRQVVARLYDAELPHARIVLIDGPTGSGKTELLARLAAKGAQTIDLEAVAAHRGSLFGALPGKGQPSQKLFETRLLGQIDRLDPARPVLVEAESSRVGERMVPPALWARMEAAARITLSAPAAARAHHLARAYADITADRAAFDHLLARLPRTTSKQVLGHWRALADAGDDEALALSLIETHYDPAYVRSARKAARTVLGEVELTDFTDASLDQAADRVLKMVGG